MKTVLLIVLAIAFCVSAQENPECESIRAKIKALRLTAKPGDLESIEAKVNEHKLRLDALGCKKEIVRPTREREDKECSNIRQKIRQARLTITDPIELSKKVDEYKKQLDGLKCVKRRTELPERANEHKECSTLRAKIRSLRATTKDPKDKPTMDKKIAEYKARMDLLKCVNRPREQRENPECASIRAKIRLVRQNRRPGEFRESEKKVKEYVERLKALKCRRTSRPVTRDNEPRRCREVRQKIRIARLTIKDKKELAKKVTQYKKQLDSMKCAKSSTVHPDRKNEHKDCSNLRAKIRQLRATVESSEDKEAMEKKIAEYRARMDKLKCVRIRPRPQNTGKCVVSGCNQELCSEKPQMSPCWFKPEFKCYRLAQCGPHGPAGECAWKKTKEFYACSGEKKMW